MLEVMYMILYSGPATGERDAPMMLSDGTWFSHSLKLIQDEMEWLSQKIGIDKKCLRVAVVVS